MTRDQNTAPRAAATSLQKWLPLLTELWIAGVIVAFAVVRVLGSNSAKHFLRRAGH